MTKRQSSRTADLQSLSPYRCNALTSSRGILHTCGTQVPCRSSDAFLLAAQSASIYSWQELPIQSLWISTSNAPRCEQDLSAETLMTRARKFECPRLSRNIVIPQPSAAEVAAAQPRVCRGQRGKGILRCHSGTNLVTASLPAPSSLDVSKEGSSCGSKPSATRLRRSRKGSLR